MTYMFSSVRLRLAAGAIAGLVVVLVLSWAGLVALFERHVERRIGSELDLHLAQLASATQVSASGQLALEPAPSDPRFGKVRGGLYWQIEDEASGSMLRSRSLWDLRLAAGAGLPAPGVVAIDDRPGPRDTRLRVHERRLLLPDGTGERVVRFSVAMDRREIDGLTADFSGDLVLALVGLGVVLAGASLLQIALGTAPLAGIGRQVAAVRGGTLRRLPSAAASEVMPLVQEVNALLDGADAQIERARARAADLAHGLKTPLAALKADAARIADQGAPEIAQGIEVAVDAMSRQVERELARTRVRHGGRGSETVLRPAVERIVAVIRRTPACDLVNVVVDIPETMCVAIDEPDLVEVMGNLIENGVRHASSHVRVGVDPAGSGLDRGCVDDDGDGLSPAERDVVLGRGVRLDSQPGGAGLGLAIVADILDAHGLALTLSTSPQGGLAASFVVRARM